MFANLLHTPASLSLGQNTRERLWLSLGLSFREQQLMSHTAPRMDAIQVESMNNTAHAILEPKESELAYF